MSELSFAKTMKPSETKNIEKTISSLDHRQTDTNEDFCEGKLISILILSFQYILDNSPERNNLLSNILCSLLSYPVFDRNSQILHCLLVEPKRLNAANLLPILNKLSYTVTEIVEADPQLKKKITLKQNGKAKATLDDRTESIVVLLQTLENFTSVLILKERSFKMMRSYKYEALAID